MLLAVACAPVVGTHDDTSTTTTGASTSSTTAEPTTESTSTSSATTALPTTDPTTLDTSTSEPASETTGCSDDATECDVWLQDCCPGVKCVPWANDGTSYWNDFRCSPIDDDPDAIGGPCTVEGSGISGIDSCEAGAFCFHVDPETNIGVCAALCTGSPEQPICDDPEQTCVIAFDGYFTLCLDRCDPLQDDCDAGVCAPFVDEFVCGDARGSDNAIGDQCWGTWDCASGGVCTSVDRLPACEGPYCCAAYCDLTLVEPCPEGLVCDPWYRDGGESPIGVCVVE